VGAAVGRPGPVGWQSYGWAERVSGYGEQSDAIGRGLPLATLRSLAIFSLCLLNVDHTLTVVRFSLLAALLDISQPLSLHRCTLLLL